MARPGAVERDIVRTTALVHPNTRGSGVEEPAGWNGMRNGEVLVNVAFLWWCNEGEHRYPGMGTI